MTTNIVYGHSFDALHGYEDYLLQLIENHNAKSICEVGGGANPLLKKDYIVNKNIDYAVLDISEGELAKAPPHYTKIVSDISSKEFTSNQKYDLVFSKMLAEHVPDGKQFHKNVLSMLSDNGIAFHFFPTLYTFPFFVNYLIPENLSQVLLDIFNPRDKYQNAKFPALYKWCRGPVKRQIHRFKGLGYDIVEYRGFFGHDYYERVKPIHKLHELKTKFLLRKPNPFFTSYAYVILKKAAQYPSRLQ